MATIELVYIVYAVVLIGGGIMGFVKAGSKASLISGLATGVIMAAAAAVYPHHHHRALYTGIVIANVASIMFIMRYIKTRKTMPAVPMIVISEFAFILSVMELVVKKP